MTSPTEPPVARPSSFDEWLQAFKEQATFFTGLKLDVGAPRWQVYPTAERPEMPAAAIATGAVQHVLPLDEIGPYLGSVTGGERTAA